ncbi:MAG: hypothetical protein M0P18_10580 [Syntrophales bacterium]|nr:hypothetical protein [Syntrophales bacterium]
MLENRQGRTILLAQSMTATKQQKPFTMGMYVISVAPHMIHLRNLNIPKQVGIHPVLRMGS